MKQEVSDHEPVLQDDQPQFLTHLANNKKVKNRIDTSKADKMVSIMWRKHNQIMFQAQQNLAERVMEAVNQNFQKYVPKNGGNNNTIDQLSLDKPQKLIIPICIRKSQEEYLQEFMNAIVERFKKVIDKLGEFDYDSDDSKVDKQLSRTRQKKVNFQDIGSRSISEIALKVKQSYTAKHIDDEISLYYTEKVTNLSRDNLYILQEGLAEVNCCLILPTFQSMENVVQIYSKFSSVEIIPFYLFEHSQLFYQLMYNCICDKEIKAYLPKQSLKVVYDFDDFPITYKDGTYRLAHLIHKLETFRNAKKIEFQFVQIHRLLTKIQDAINKIFHNLFNKKKQILKKYILCILDEEQHFNVLDKYLNKTQWKNWENSVDGKTVGQSDETQLVMKLRNKIIKRVEDSDTLSPFLRHFTEQQKPKSTRKKDKDLNRFGIQPEMHLDQKSVLQNQIKAIINDVTSQIRKQALQFPWADYLYMQSVKPMLPYNIYLSASKMPVHGELIKFIYQKISTPLVYIIQQFCENRNMTPGQLMYYMKDLQLYGLINMNSDVLNPIVTPAFFMKSTYKTREFK